MSSILRKFQPTPALVVAMIALLTALSGSAVAASLISANTVVSKSIVNGEVRSKDLAADSVRSGKVKDASLTGADVQDASLTGADVQDESLTGTDVQDGTLAGADVTDNSLSGDDVNESTLQGVMASQVRTVTAETAPVQFGAVVEVACAATEKAIGGGAAWIIPGSGDPTALEAPITASMPTPGGPGVNHNTGWKAAGRNLAGTPRILRVYATCVPKQVS